jgi:hypothetical protein
MWRTERDKGKATLVVLSLRTLEKQELMGVSEEGAALLGFIAPGDVHDVRVSPAD